jgi:hypothetical protein
MRSWRKVNVLASADGVRVRQAFAARLDALGSPEQRSSEQALCFGMEFQRQLTGRSRETDRASW